MFPPSPGPDQSEPDEPFHDPAPRVPPPATEEGSPKKDPPQKSGVKLLLTPALIAGLVCAAVLLAAAVPYLRFARQIDSRLRDGAFPDAVNVYAAPLVIAQGDSLSASDLAAELETAGFSENAPAGPAGSYRVSGPEVKIFPAGTASSCTVTLAGGRIARITSNGRELRQIETRSPLLTTLSAGEKDTDTRNTRRSEERVIVPFAAIPPVLTNAIVAVEDKHFFSHHGLDLPRIVRAAWVDFRDQRKEQGASTLTMQLVRNLWLTPRKSWTRKFAEVMMTVHLEHTWSKQRIFEAYVNQVYLGRQAAYSVHGFGEASRLYFGKELRDISLPEAALLAGLVQRPSYFNPFRYAERAGERRNLVLGLMRENGYISAAEYDNAVSAPVQVSASSVSAARAPWFLDLVNDELTKTREGGELPGTVFTTIDLNLQRAAEQAVAAGMQEVDRQLAARKADAGAKAEVALIALDPHTGEIKALIGGRDYARSQLNRVFAKRPPGSVFKPFVYAAALTSGISGSDGFTPASMVDDTPTTFWFGGKPYQPANYRGQVYGTLTLRDALAHSDNIAAVRVAEAIGYGEVVNMARRAGLNDGIKATPAVALGAYQVTPLEMAGAYTVFANGGYYVPPTVIAGARASLRQAPSHQALDPRVNWLMVNMMESVLQYGTGAGVRARGFTLPAAGKTGTSHDGWFAGFTSRLLCIVWVGFDDYRELNLEGARSALPIWTEFMKRAALLGAYRNAQEFAMPDGIDQVQICRLTGKRAGPYCPDTRPEYFVAGTEPPDCDLHKGQPDNDATTDDLPAFITVAEP